SIFGFIEEFGRLNPSSPRPSSPVPSPLPHREKREKSLRDCLWAGGSPLPVREGGGVGRGARGEGLPRQRLLQPVPPPSPDRSLHPLLSGSFLPLLSTTTKWPWGLGLSSRTASRLTMAERWMRRKRSSGNFDSTPDIVSRRRWDWPLELRRT